MVEITDTHVLPEYKGQDGCSELCQEYDKDKQEELRTKKNRSRKDTPLNIIITIIITYAFELNKK